MPARDIAAIVGINAIFSGVYLAGKIGVGHFPPLFFSALRFLIVLVALAPFLRAEPAFRARWKTVAAFCLLMGPVTYGLIYAGLAAADGVAAVFIGTQASTLIAVLLGWLWLGEKIPPTMWAGLAVAFAGVVVVGFDAALLGYPGAFALIVGSAVSYAAASVAARGLAGAAGILNLNGWMALTAAPILLGLSLALEDGQWESLTTADATGWTMLLYSALAVSVLGHGGMFWLLQRHPISAVMPYYVLTPIFGVIGGVVFFGEALTTQFIAGAALALAGVFWVNRNLSRAAAATPEG